MYFDDAFIAYVNGKEVARSSVDSSGKVKPTRDPKIKRYLIEIPFAKNNQYTLAIEGFNHHKKSSDFSLIPWLGTKYLDASQRKWMAIPKVLTKVQATNDIEELQYYLKDRASYLTRNNIDTITELSHLISALPEMVNTQKFAGLLHEKILGMGDCHYKMTPSPMFSQKGGNLPFKLARTNVGWVAIEARGGDLLHDDYPLVKEVNGIPLEKLKIQASRYVNACSKQMVDKSSLSVMQYYFPKVITNFVSDIDDEMKITLGRMSDESTFTVTLPFSKRQVSRSKKKHPKSHALSENIGYLRINSMNRNVDDVHQAMREFKDTDGLIIDIRNNGGGTYEILDAIYGYFLPAGDIGKIINIAAVKNSKAFKANHLDYRKTYPLDSDHWNDKQREMIKAFSSSFSPQWSFPRQNYREWLYRIAEPQAQQYHYTKPVIVLTNAGSASASDGFSNAFKLLPQATIMGEATAGMSGSNRPVTLGYSKLTLNLSSMISFRPNGQLFEGNGVEVDIEQLPTVNDYIYHEDSVLKSAHNILTK
jgi:C-terminal processing protease CtpA/Prc